MERRVTAKTALTALSAAAYLSIIEKRQKATHRKRQKSDGQ
jgi:hypothetical protein